MSVAVGSLPSRFRVDSTDGEIRRLSRIRDDRDPPRRKADGSIDERTVAKLPPSARARLARIASGEGVSPHVIGSVRFGPDRLTTCDSCAFTATGATDRAMATAWDAHPIAVRQAFARARRAASRM